MEKKRQRRITYTIIGMVLTAAVLLFAVLLRGTDDPSIGAAASAENGRDSDTLRVTLKGAKDAYDADEALFVDVRSSAQFESSHVPGAILIPVNDISENEPAVAKDTLIFTYCT